METKRLITSGKRPEATVKGTPAEWRQWFEEGNRLPETKLDALEKLAHSDEGEPADHRSLRISLQQIRACLANGDARWAVCHALTAGVLAHSLGWSEKDAETGGKVRDGGKKGSEKTYGDSESKLTRWRQHQTCLEAVALEHPEWDRESAQKETARRRGCGLRTIQRHTAWPDN